MIMQFQDDIAAGVVLVRPALQSPDYDPGVSGWAVMIDGSAEFNDVTIRGGTTVSGTSLYYSGTPGPGTLIMAIAGTAGTDPYGNAYPAGMSVGASGGRRIIMSRSASDARIDFLANSAKSDQSGVLLESVLNAGAANEYLTLQMISPAVKAPAGDTIRLSVNSQNADGSSNANLAVQHSSAGTLLTLDPVGLQTTVPITSYASNAFTTFTPTVTGDGGATYTTRTGRWQQVGKWAWVEIDLQVATAGTGTTPISVTGPVTLDKSVRQFLPGNGDSLTGNSGALAALSLTGANSNVFDRVRNSTGANLTGASLQAGGVVTLRGWCRMA